MKCPKETWFFRGREARGLGRDRIIPDGRVSVEHRQAFYDGWDEEDRLRKPAPTAEQIAESGRVHSGLKSFVADMRAGKI